MSNGQEFLNDQEKDTLAGELVMERARATRDLAQLATVFGLAEEQTVGLVAAFRLHAEQLSVTKLDVIHQHAVGLATALGDIALQAPVEEQTIVEIATGSTPLTQGEVVALPSIDREEETTAITLNARTVRFMDDIFGDCTMLNLREADKPSIVDALLALPTTIERTRKVTASLRMRLGLMLAGATNATIAAAEGHNDARVLANAFTRFKATIRDSTPDEARAVLADAMVPKESSRETTSVLEVAPMGEAGAVSTITHEESAPISAISYEPTVLDKRQQRTKAAREQAAPLSSQPEFDRLKKNITEALGDDAIGLLSDDVTVADLASVIAAAYAKNYGAQPYDNFVRFFIANLEGKARTFELAKEYALDLSTVGSTCKTMPGLIAAELRAGNQTGPKQAPGVVTPNLFATLRKPQLSPEADDCIESIVAVAKPELVVMSDKQPAGDVLPGQIDYSPVVQDLIKAAIEPESTTAKEWFATSRQFIMGLEQFSPEEKIALWNRICHDPRKRKHTHLTSHTRAAIDKLRLARDKVVAMPDELIGTSLDYFLQADEGKYDIADIHTKISYKYDKTNRPPVHAIERCVTAGIGAVLAG